MHRRVVKTCHQKLWKNSIVQQPISEIIIMQWMSITELYIKI